MKEEGIVSMVISNGLFIMGKLIGGNKLTDPRVFSIINVPKKDENGKYVRDINEEIKTEELMQLAPLPGAPGVCRVSTDVVVYSLPLNVYNKALLDLYDKVTHPPEKPIVMPEQPTVN